MKRAFLILMAGIAVAGLAGCAADGCRDSGGKHLLGCHQGTCASAPETCASCGGGRQGCGDPNCPNCGGDPRGGGDGRDGPLARQRAEFNAYHGGQPGPLTGAVAYPYYSVRGPRDFLARDPASIGP
jgi:hypothetical protein